MTTSVRAAGAWRTVVLSNRLQYLRVGGVWKPILDYWYRVGGAWVKESGYSPTLAAPTNLRMNPADANNHSTIPVAWDYNVAAGQLSANDFYIVLTDEAGNWLQYGPIANSYRSWSFGSL